MGFLGRLQRATGWSAHVYGQPSDGAEPDVVVREYVRARHDWERRARSPLATDTTRRTELAVILASFCTPAAAERQPTISFGTVPEWQPNHLEVLRVDATFPRAVVVTREHPFYVAENPDVTMDFRYALRLLDGGWRIDARTTTSYDGDAIESL